MIDRLLSSAKLIEVIVAFIALAFAGVVSINTAMALTERRLIELERKAQSIERIERNIVRIGTKLGVTLEEPR